MSKSMIEVVANNGGMILARGNVFVLPHVGDKINLRLPIDNQKTRSYWYKVTTVVHDWNVLKTRDGDTQVDLIDEGVVKIFVEDGWGG